MTKKYKITQTMIDYDVSTWEVEADSEDAAKEKFQKFSHWGSEDGIKRLSGKESGETQIEVQELR